MTILRTPDEYARAVLAISVLHFGLRPGELLPRKNFQSIWPKRGYRHKDLQTGLQYATESGWLEMLPGGKLYRLTKSGFVDG